MVSKMAICFLLFPNKLFLSIRIMDLRFFTNPSNDRQLISQFSNSLISIQLLTKSRSHEGNTGSRSVK